MTPLEQRIAEALVTAGGNPGESATGWWLDLARAVVAVLPSADVSDKVKRMLARVKSDADDGLAEEIQALFDAQAAAHAAEVERLNDSLDYANKGKAELEAEVAALRAEVERLSGIVAEGWALGSATTATIAKLTADRDAYRARIDKVRALCDWFDTVALGQPLTTYKVRAALDGDA